MFNPVVLKQAKWKKGFCLMLLSSVLILSGCDRDGDEDNSKSVKSNEPNSFAAFINPIAALASGDYVIEVNTDNAGEAGDFTLSVTYDDGTTEEYDGSWTADTSTRTFNITVYTAGGIIITLESPVENNLRLLNSNGFVIATDGVAAAGDSTITLYDSRIDSAEYGAAYYAAVDPNNDKDTLEKWKLANGFYEVTDDSRIIQPRFRDTKDLGYGRGMRMWTKPDGSLYFFVENFQIRTLPGEEYTTLNLEALLTNARKHHFGSNAIEFSTFPYGVGEPCAFGSGAACATTNANPPKFTKFYTFDATQGSQTREDHENEVRLDEVNLDGRGDKAMPGACVYCHGGTLRPLRADGTFRDNTLDGTSGNGINGDVNAKLQLLEVPSFEYGDESPYRKEDQEPIIKQVNLAIYCTYPNLPDEGVQAACAEYCIDPADTANCGGPGVDILDVIDIDAGDGQWDGAFATEMTEGWYDDSAVTGMFDRDTFNEEYVPDAWQYDSSDNIPPPGSDQLFLEVVQPVCFVCHSRRGTNLGTNGPTRGDGKDINFDSYEKFITHADQIKQYVYDRGVMPLSLRGYLAFWDEDSSAPEILAAHLNGVLAAGNQVELNDDDEVEEPGDPIADAGPDRTTTSPVRMFGSNSRYVERYSWSITSEPDGSDAVLTEPTTSRPLLTTSVDGDYDLLLVAAYGNKVVSDTVHIKIDNTMSSSSTPPDPKFITFDDHIKPVFGNAGGFDGKECTECHTGVASDAEGLPMFWTDSQPLTGSTFFEEVRSRIDFNDPENSLLLTKPSDNHHYGGLRGGFEVDNPSNRHNYDLFLNWIMEGAPEN